MYRRIPTPAFSEVRTLLSKAPFFSMRSLEKYSAGMGRNRPHHVRPLRQCLGRQSRNRGGQLPGVTLPAG
jgi:hypothetical protein